jgi:hypothetical protein
MRKSKPPGDYSNHTVSILALVSFDSPAIPLIEQLEKRA